MSSDDEKSPLVLEFEEFQHKLHGAIRLLYFDFQDESKRILDVAFFPSASRARNTAAEQNHVLLIPDANDLGRSISIRGSDQRQRMDGALWYYLETLLARMIPHVRGRFKVGATIARRYSSSDLLLHELHFAALRILENQDSLAFLCEFWGRPEFVAPFKTRFLTMFGKEIERLRSEAELEAHSPKSIAGEKIIEREPAPELAMESDRESEVTKTSSFGSPEKSPSLDATAGPGLIDPKPLDWKIEKGKEVYELYEELKRLRNHAKGGKSEEELRRDYRNDFKVWRQIDNCTPLTEESRKDFFGRLPTADAEDLYEFIGRMFCTGAVNAKLWRVLYRRSLPRRKKRKRLRKLVKSDRRAA